MLANERKPEPLSEESERLLKIGIEQVKKGKVSPLDEELLDKDDNEDQKPRENNMSHDTGRAKFKDGTVMYFEFDGLRVIGNLYNTENEMLKNWRNHPDYTIPKTIVDEEEVVLSTMYGEKTEIPESDWRSWKGKASKSLKIVTAGFEGWQDYDSNYDDCPASPFQFKFADEVKKQTGSRKA